MKHQTALLVSMMLILAVGARVTEAACFIIAGPNVSCDEQNDSAEYYTNYVDFINAAGGNDSITIYGQLGDNLNDNSNEGFYGGTGNDTLTNNGTIVAYAGITDGTGIPNDGYYDSLTNNGSIRSGDVGIEGGDGDVLTNNGTIVSNNVGIECSTQVNGCLVNNSGLINAPLGVSTGPLTGSSTLINYAGGAIVSSTGVIMSFGNDHLLNAGGNIVGGISMNPGNDVLTNSGYLDDVSLGDGNDYAINTTNGEIDGYLSAGNGNDTVGNYDSISGSVSMDGGADYVLNYGLGTATSLHARVNGGFFGGEGNDTVINSINAFIGGMDGGPGNDIVRNHSIVAGVMLGGDGSDTVTNTNGGLTNYLSGDAGADSVSNGGAVNSSIDGGAGNDTVTNFAGGVASWLNGGADNDTVLNGGFVNADLSGGSGNDSVVNLAGAFVSQMYGEGGNDTVVNGGFLLGSAYGGDDNDRVTNLGGAQATHLSGDYGNDSVFNGGYLVGQLYGGFGDDTVVNAAFSYSAGANLGDGNDQFVNGGYLNGSVVCGPGADVVSIGGIVAGGIQCDDGSDTVVIIGGVVAGTGGQVVGLINGGTGLDGLTFAFNLIVRSAADITTISNALAAASPAGGTITLGGSTYSWVNFEALYNLLTFSINEPVTITITVPRRLNAADAAAPVAVYCAADAVELWTIGADGAGSFAFSVPLADVNTGTTVSAQGVTFESTAGGSFAVSATASDGKPYSFTGSCG